jgi:RimJ/RimL family protein N-acetyltransferase
VEWGFVLAVPLWGKGIFVESATLILDFLFGEVAEAWRNRRLG